MNNQEILDNAPKGEGIDVVDITGEYFDEHCNHLDSRGLWSPHNIGPVSPRSLADIKRIVELEKVRDEKIIERLKEDALVMANARRLIKANVRTSNGRLYSEIFGTGCGSGRQGSRNLGLDPDGNKTCYSAMCSYIDEALKEPKT
jgi:hypothetical protein